MRRHPFFLSALGASLLTVALATAASGLLQPIDLHVYDVLARFARTGSSSNRVAVVAVDDRSLESIGQWPWPRDVVASLIDRLRDLGASVVALDMVFAEPDRAAMPASPGSPAATDAVLAQAIRAGGVVLGYGLTFGNVPAVSRDDLLHPLPAIVVEHPGQVPPSASLFQATSCVCNLPELSHATGRSGFLNVSADADGALRRVPLLMASGDRIYPSLALAAVQAFAPGEVVLLSRTDGQLQLALNGQPVSLDEHGAMALRFRDAGQRVEHLAAVDVLNGRIPSSAVQGRIVFVGATALGVGEAVSTPLPLRSAGIDVHALAAENLLQQDFLAMMPFRRLIEIVAGLALGPLIALMIGRFGYRRGALAGGATLLIVWAAAALLLSRWGLFLSPLVPTLAAGATLTAVVATGFTMERWRADNERRRREHAHEFIAQSLTSLMEIRDPSTGSHARRTQGYSRLLMRHMADMPEFRHYLTADRIEMMSLLAPLHDIGKVGIRDAVLNKPGPLTSDEMHEMRQHPVYGYETIEKAQRQSQVDGLQDEVILQLAKDIVYTHHERWDGKGYPRGLRGAEIPVAGRIMAVVDVYDALVETRPYRRQMPHDEAVGLIVAGRGTQFDPDVIDAFLTVSVDFLQFGANLREGAPLTH